MVKLVLQLITRHAPWVIAVVVAMSYAYAAIEGTRKTFNLKNGNVTLTVPKDWQDLEKFYGMPVSLLGPTKAGFRPVISVTATEMTTDQVGFDPKQIEKSSADYKKGRLEWLKKMNGEAVSFDRYQEEKWKGIETAHTIGYRYKLGDKEYIEKSYYVLCQKKLYHIKSMYIEAHAKDYAETVKDTVKTFSCGQGG